MEKRMTKLGLLGAAAMVLCSALASPSMAQDVTIQPGTCANGTCQNSAVRGDVQRRVAYRHADHGRAERDYGWNDNRPNDNGWNDRGFWPADVAAGAVGGAIGTAGAIATAPFRADSYAWDNGSRNGWNQSYAERNGFVCTPGTWFRGEDGRRHICQ
jgi:hypothetical protein